MFTIHKRNIRPTDIVRGRGAGCVHNVYHQKMLRRKDRLRRKYNYSSLKTHKDKQQVQAKLLQSIHRRNGRVLAKVPNSRNLYYELPYKQALALMCTKLREERVASKNNDANSIASDTTTTSLENVMQMLEMADDFEHININDFEASIIDFNGVVPV
jgi:hypothetical protein